MIDTTEKNTKPGLGDSAGNGADLAERMRKRLEWENMASEDTPGSTQAGEVRLDHCPICGVFIGIIGNTLDGRLVGTCHDAFTVKQWKS